MQDSLYLEDIEIGKSYITPGRTVAEADILQYAGLSGDCHRLHTDEVFCKNTIYGTRIAHGPLGITLGLGLLARLSLFENTAMGFLGIENWTFKNPMKIGDTVHVEVEFTKKRKTSKPGRGLYWRHISIVNQHGEVLQEGTFVNMVKTKEEVS